ncbi:MAG: hypothetical protein FWF38_06445 [Spirochaetaceae bacterium]|nr:hypothetical protein [Spirochaetaceae bacterium]
MKMHKITKPKMTPKIRNMIKKAPAFNIEDIEELKDFKPGPVVARGFAQFKEYINRKGRPKARSRKEKISIRLPEDTVASLREVEGYSTILGNYIMSGIESGALRLPQSSGKS